MQLPTFSSPLTLVGKNMTNKQIFAKALIFCKLVLPICKIEHKFMFRHNSRTAYNKLRWIANIKTNIFLRTSNVLHVAKETND